MPLHYIVEQGMNHPIAQETPDTEQLRAEYAEIWNEGTDATMPAVVSESFVMYNPAVPEDKTDRIRINIFRRSYR